MARLAGKRALITGGSRGIGAAISAAMAAEGAQVLPVAVARPAELADNVIWHSADVSHQADVDEITQAVQEKLGGLDVLVNNAGIQVEKTVTESTDADWDDVIGINAKAPFMLCRALILMVAGGGGSIVNIGSISGHHADRRWRSIMPLRHLFTG